jgi:hypothetical protein
LWGGRPRLQRVSRPAQPWQLTLSRRLPQIAELVDADGSVWKHHVDFELASNTFDKLGKRAHVDVGTPLHPRDSGLLQAQLMPQFRLGHGAGRAQFIEGHVL